VNPSPDPTNYAGETGAFSCVCPFTVMEVHAVLTDSSTAPQGSGSGCNQNSAVCGLASYDLRSGQLSTSFSGGGVTAVQGGGSVSSKDIYYAVGPRGGTPLSLVAEYELGLSANGVADAGGSLVYGDSVLTASFHEGGPNQTLRLTVKVVAHEPFVIRLSSTAGGGETGWGSAGSGGRLSFVTPSGVTVRSCQGYASSSTVNAFLVEEVDARTDEVRITWRWPGGAGRTVQVYRADGSGQWVARGDVVADGTDRVSHEDRNVVPGARYGYRLGLGAATFGETWVTIPAPEALRLEALVPNPAANHVTVRFTLRGGAPARIALVDIAGREVIARDLRNMGRGPHTLDLLRGARLPAGVYHVRLTEGVDGQTARLVLIQ
jgi:hypothetical protein